MIEPSPRQRQLFEQALLLGAADREVFLDTCCSDPDERAVLERLLAADTEADGPLLGQSAEDLFERVGEISHAPPSGSCIGPFVLLDKLGEGGSSIVYRGEREQAGVRQQVALKLLRRGLHTADEQRHFRVERRALAQLQHPGIARLIEGGLTATGVPYIALELVEGQGIVDHARAHRLSLRQRLALFIDVCRAVEAAHRALIVHRDLKPSNILVTADGNVKLLDFGIAKLLDIDAEAQDAATQHAPMTPAYAAPEQFAHGPITTATDVYALGVVLGELITGQRREPGNSRTPSSQVSENSAEQTGTPSARVLRRKLRGDLDNIVLKATAQDADDRYASAGALADDIARHLAGQPVVAHPPSTLYRARKFVSRHRGGVATTALFLLAIVASLGVALWQASVARNEAQRANSVRDFLLRVFSAAEPAGPRLAPPSVVDVVRASVREAQQSRSLHPAVRIELLESLGNVLRTQGALDDSLALLASNYEAAKATLGVDNPTTELAGLGLARARVDAGQRPAARALFDELLQHQASAGPDLRSRLLAASALLGIDRFERDRAGKESIDAITECVKYRCSEPVRINALLARGYVLASFQQDEAAIPIMLDALQAQRAYFTGPHVDIADNEQGLSRAYRRLGQLDRAEALARDSLAIVEASVPDPHVRRTDALDTLRQVLIDEREFDEAETLGQRLIAMDRATLGPDHPGVATSENTLGFTYMMDGKFGSAIEHFRAALDLSERIPDNQRRSAIYRSNLGVSIGKNGDHAKGMQLIRTSIDALRALPEPDDDQICSALEKLGALQRFAGDAEGSRDSYAESIRIYREKLPDAPKAWRVVSLVGLGRAQIETGDDAKAADTLNEALANIATPAGRVSPDRIEARAALAGVMHRRGDDGKARTLLDQARQEVSAAHGRLSTGLQAFVDSVETSMGGSVRADGRVDQDPAAKP
jgi:eukaryotic-like serine/threonine-protein kinase